MNTMDHNRSTLDIRSKGRIAVLPVEGIPGKNGEDGDPGPPGDSVVEDPPVNLTVLFENALQG